MRFKIANDLPNLVLNGQEFPVNQQIIDIPPELEGELRKSFPNAEEVTTDPSSENPSAGGVDGRNKVLRP